MTTANANNATLSDAAALLLRMTLTSLPLYQMTQGNQTSGSSYSYWEFSCHLYLPFELVRM